MSSFKGFGILASSDLSARIANQKNLSSLDAEERTALWQAGLLPLHLPKSLQPRALTAAEKHWLSCAIQAEYLASGDAEQPALFYTASPPRFHLEEADWYLYPNEYWNQPPVRLQQMMQQFPSDCFQLNAAGQPPGFYPDRTPDYSLTQEAIMRQIFRETVRLGWSLADYKWYVMQHLRKTTAQVIEAEASQLLHQLQQYESASD